jgi:hypothetical protein
VNQDPFSAYRINKPQQTQENIQSKQPSQEDPFSQYRIKKSEDIPGIYEIGRHAARIGSRIAETIGGIPGDVSSLIQSGVLSGLEKLSGHEVSEESKEQLKKQRLPTSGELKKFSQEKTKGYTKPQNEAERFGDELAETAASLLGPMKFRKVLGVALGASAAKEGVKLLGLGDTSQEAAKLGTMVMLTAMNPKGAMKYASSQYEKANALSKGASIPVTNFRGNLENLKKDLQKGVTTSSKNAVLKPIDDLLAKVTNNNMLVEDLTAAKRDLNSIMKDPELLQREKKLLKVVGKEIDNAIKPYEQINPAFKKAYRPANEIYGAVMQGTKAFDFIRKSLGGKSILASVIAETALGHPEYIPYTFAGMASVGAAAKTSDFFVRLAKSKELQKYYSKAIAAAASKDLAALRTYSDKIDEIFDSKNPHYRKTQTNKPK